MSKNQGMEKHHKIGQRLEKILAILRQNPSGIEILKLAKKVGVGKSTIYSDLGTLDNQGRAYYHKGFAYPERLKEATQAHKEKSSSDRRQRESLRGNDDTIKEVQEIRKDYLNNHIDRAFKSTMLLLQTKNDLPKDWVEKKIHLFHSLDAELEPIRENSLEQYNPMRRQRIYQLKKAIVYEALKNWT